ncbi:ankyrin repeat-containing domain protein [Dunaliella salina]|uniref:Ankyrin repeat-containing domain protein n=1 Tax=Dunaliella salina TaxID=3046 RepID=A0ABQ7H805_DUNSA|nr:ankyrin repeat-containing domain protein [Dunaliella salina]|eukprot:KAF5842989.1 ankyrin repeat-containing domain protein [Dunaliella salina]
MERYPTCMPRVQRPLAAVLLPPHADLAGIRAVDRTKSTPLHHACMSGLVDVVAGLVRREGLEVNALDALKRTPLTIASKAGHEPVVELLCGIPGIDFNHADCEGENPLLAACSEGHAGIVELLLRQVPVLDIMVRMVDHAGPLYLAAGRGHCDVVRALLRVFALVGASVNVRGPHRSTALHAACEQGHTQVVELLLGVEGIDKQALNRSGYRPIDLAMKHPRIVKLLLDHKDSAPSVAMDEVGDPSTTPDSDDFGLWDAEASSEDTGSLEQ